MPGYPAIALPYVTELLVNGTWTNITADVRDSAEYPGPEIVRGRADESARVTPSTCRLTLSNNSGAYSNRLPTSTFYGQLGRNTQLRHRLRWVFDTFTRNASNGFGSDETPMANAWTTSGGSAADYSVTTAGTGVAQIAFSAASTRKQAQTGPVLSSCRVTGQVKPGVVALGAPIDMGFNLRRDSVADTAYEVLVRFEAGATMRLRVNKVISGSATTVAEVVLPGSYTANSFMWIVADIKGSRIRARTWNTGLTDPVSWQLDFTDTAITAPGQMGGPIARVQSGNTNVPVTLLWNQVDVSDYRFWGEIPAWPQTWDISGADVTAPIEAAGIMRRLGTGARPLRSAMYRSMAGIAAGDFRPIQYWPCEDGSDATTIANAIGGAAPAAVSGGAALASYSTIVGSEPLPILNVGTQIQAVIPPYNDTGVWQLQFVMNIPSQPAAAVTYLDIPVDSGSGSSVAKVRLYYDDVSTFLRIQLLDGTGTEIASNGLPVIYGKPYLYGISQFASGGGVQTTLSQYSVQGFVSQTSTFTSGNPDRPTSWVASANATNAGWTIGHVALYTDPAVLTTPSLGPNSAGMAGYTGETAGARMVRLCREEGIALDVVGDPADTSLMGAQTTDTLLANLQACADVDQGILGEPRDALGLLYRTNHSLLNQVGPALDYSAQRLAPPLLPTEDDQLVRNRVTATRPGGSSATAEQTAGSLSTQDPPNGIGLYDSQISVNTYTDSQLQYEAGWQVRLGTWDEARYPQVNANFARLLTDGQAALAGQVAGLDVGDYLSITNPPSWLPPDAIELLAEGYRESHRGFEWTLALNCVPAGPYNAFIIGDQTRGRLDTSGCVLNQAVSSGATSLRLCIWDGPPSITSAARPGDFPFDLALRPSNMDANTGERVRVTAMASVTVPTFVATGTASSGSSGSRTPGLPTGAASGDLILILASTRNSGTGTVDTPSGWTELVDMGNASLIGRIYDGVWTMPTVTFSSGAANEDTLAQSAAFRNMCVDLNHIVHSSATQLNASAQNIDLPELGVRRDNCVVLYLAWKQDDFSAVTNPAGTTEIEELFSTAGNDAGQVWGYQIQTTQAGASFGTRTVTGGAAAISRSAVVALAGGYQTATVTRSINGVVKAQAAGIPVSLWRPARPAL